MGQVHHSKLQVDRENDGAMDFLTQISALRTSCTKQVRDNIATKNGRDGFVLTPPTGLKTRDFRRPGRHQRWYRLHNEPPPSPRNPATFVCLMLVKIHAATRPRRPTHPHANYRPLTASSEPSSHSESVATAGGRGAVTLRLRTAITACSQRRFVHQQQAAAFAASS